jgi:hypothetical protein
MRILVTIVSAFLFMSFTAVASADCRCMGCGCMGGSGWRDNTDRCVGRNELRRVCGNPPSKNCRYEGAKQICDSKSSNKGTSSSGNSNSGSSIRVITAPKP